MQPFTGPGRALRPRDVTRSDLRVVLCCGSEWSVDDLQAQAEQTLGSLAGDRREDSRATEAQSPRNLALSQQGERPVRAAAGGSPQPPPPH